MKPYQDIPNCHIPDLGTAMGLVLLHLARAVEDEFAGEWPYIREERIYNAMRRAIDSEEGGKRPRAPQNTKPGGPMR